ncbi:MAG TPA: hypothetical protein VJU59_35365 [Paraburkholderia sp.]|uniref:non-homologous end-joining DNA ligase LigD n=1 Tax=Paraburkholderia sp. TaxID=1926495 RepID=UPI002B4946C5|nr:hypothetical protein [Paraburkholderia sp.]HKR44892.1 hypothetical protein [Paraburkholderia sp.]
MSPLIITHAERIIDPLTGVTKAGLVSYYASAAEWMLPHLLSRPIAMVRAPDGIAGTLFFQKHFQKHADCKGMPVLAAVTGVASSRIHYAHMRTTIWQSCSRDAATSRSLCVSSAPTYRRLIT